MNSFRPKLAELVLPPVPVPSANYLPYVLSGHLLFISGQSPCSATGVWSVGKLGAEIDLEEGYRRARLTGLRLLAVAQLALGSLDRVQQVVKLTGFVNSAPDFHLQPKVLDGCSDLLLDVFGEAGRHARSAVGVSSLPEDVTVEIDAIFAIWPLPSQP